MFISKKNNISSNQKQPLIKSIMNDEMNNECFDCGSSNPQFISINNAIFLCRNCSNLHKTFPLEISKIINNNLYKLDEKELYYLFFGGNRRLSELIYLNPKLSKYKNDVLYKTDELKNYRYNLSNIVNEKIGINNNIENYKYMKNNFDFYNFNTLNQKNQYNRKKILYLSENEDYDNILNESKYARLSTTNKIPKKYQKRFIPDFDDSFQNDRFSVHNRKPPILLDMSYGNDIMNLSNKNSNSVLLNNYNYEKDNKNKTYGHLGFTTNFNYKNYINNSININNSNNNNFYINQSDNDIDKKYNVRNSAHDNHISFYNKFKLEIPNKYKIPQIINSSYNLSTFRVYAKPKLPRCAINLKKSKKTLKSSNFSGLDNYYTIQNINNNNISKKNKIMINTKNNLNYVNNIRDKYNQIKSKKAQEKKLLNDNKIKLNEKSRQISMKSSNFILSNEDDSDKVQNLSIIDIDKKSEINSSNEKKSKIKKRKKYNKKYYERKNFEKEERKKMELEEKRRKEELKRIQEQKKLLKQKNRKKMTKKEKLKLIEEERFTMQQEEIKAKKKKAFENKVIKEEDEEYEQENDNDIPQNLNKNKSEFEDKKEINTKTDVISNNNNNNEIIDKSKKNEIVDTFKNSIRNRYKRRKNNI